MGWNRKCSEPPLWVRNGYTHAVVRRIIYPDTVGNILLRLIPGDTIFCHCGVHRNMTCHEFGFCSFPRPSHTQKRARTMPRQYQEPVSIVSYSSSFAIYPIYYVVFRKLLLLLTYPNLITPLFICQRKFLFLEKNISYPFR